jgi:hypothetical protein
MWLNRLLLIGFILFGWSAGAQVSNTGLMDTLDGIHIQGLSVGGYVDSYFGYLADSGQKELPLFVSSNRLNEMNINLAYADIRYADRDVRARIVPAFGTFMNANYAREQGTLRNLLEASGGICLSKKKDVWIDVGIFGSPFTNESAISKDHLMYTRSLAPEYVPYYLAGARLSAPISKKLKGYFYALNGWQEIADQNASKSVATQLEYRPDSNQLFNWNVYVGNEQGEIHPNYRMRYFSDVYWIYSPKSRWHFTSCMYGGLQEVVQVSVRRSITWWQANFIARYQWSKRFSVSGRIEYFSDPGLVVLPLFTMLSGIANGSTSACFNVQLNDHAMFRLETRWFYAQDYHVVDFTGVNWWTVGNLTVWF